MILDLQLLPHQADFVTDTTTRNLALVGGYGCGKTYSMAAKLTTLALLNPGYEGIALSPTYGMAQKVLVPAIDDQLRATRLRYHLNKSDLTFDIHVPGSAKPTRLHVMAAESYRRTAGINAAFFGVDEADLIEPDTARAAWRMLSSRLRKGRVYQGCSTSTPEGFKFLWSYFVDEVEKDPSLRESRRVIHASTYDNPFLPQDYIAELEQQYPPHLIDAYLRGQFVNLLGTTVYYCYDRDLNGTSKTVADYPNSVLHVGMDFNVGRMSAVVSVVDNGAVYVLDELYGARNTEELIQKLKARYPRRPTGSFYIYPDSSGKNASANAPRSSIALLQDAGFEVRFRNANPRIPDRVASVNLRFKDMHGVRRAFVNHRTCPQLVKGLMNQAYDREGKPDKSGDIDHCLDALGYFIYFNYPAQGRGASYTVVG